MKNGQINNGLCAVSPLFRAKGRSKSKPRGGILDPCPVHCHRLGNTRGLLQPPPPKALLSVLTGSWGSKGGEGNVHSCMICASLKEEISQAPINQPMDNPTGVRPQTECHSERTENKEPRSNPQNPHGHEAE